MISMKTKKKVGPRDHGRKMSLKAFEFVPVEEGHFFELARGYIVASEGAIYSHAMQKNVILSRLGHYAVTHDGRVYATLENMNCKLLIPDWESERHPDIAVYLTAPSGPKDRTMWRTWIPERVVEVVSESSRDRDYTEKRDEYWTLGVKEYWIVDAKLKQVLVLRRGRTKWIEKTLGPAHLCETKLLPGFKLACKAIFDAAGDGEEM
jgi:Uma2 family endonuclease